MEEGVNGDEGLNEEDRGVVEEMGWLVKDLDGVEVNVLLGLGPTNGIGAS